MSLIKRFILFLIAFVSTATTMVASDKAFSVSNGHASLAIDDNEAEVVKTAVSLLKRDWQEVFGTRLDTAFTDSKIIVGTVGTNSTLKHCGVSLKELKGKKQAFLIEVNKDGNLVIAGSDKHGTAYGIMELSRLIGVSPWEWWADVKPHHRDAFTLSTGFKTLQYPSVEYRGIFINDEDWGLMPWSYKTNDPQRRGIVGPKTTECIFELLLRLRANTYWPPMHECTYPFFMTKGNRETARRFGIYMGASHCEPMASSAAAEWRLRGEGDYNYVTNRDGVLRFWQDRVREVAGQEVLYTIGMRGVHDGAMQGANSASEQKAVLSQVFDDQRALLRKYVSKDVKKVPQVFIPYKEVLDVYNAGLTVPDDVTLMWCDDNYGYIRHLPTQAERKRSGGNGIYYHESYWGRPHDYLWLGTFSPALMFHQMMRAYDNGIRKIWILNVGDIKPAEYQTELFMDMAWNIEGVRLTGVDKHLENFLVREFGDVGHRLAPIMREYYRLNYICKPEFLGNTRTEESDPAYSVVKDMPWSEDFIRERIDSFNRLYDTVVQIEPSIEDSLKDAYFQQVQYPVQACALMNKKMLTAQLARHGMADFEDADRAYNEIVTLTEKYNSGINNNGKWRYIMDFRPRELPVFDPVIRKWEKKPLHIDTKPILLRSATECTRGRVQACQSLGYYGKAGEIQINDTLEFDFDSVETDSVMVSVGVVPTHPMIDNGHLRLEIRIDDSEPTIVGFETTGRSEEWKQNVLRNLAVRQLRLPLSQYNHHTLYIKAADNGVVLDYIKITK